MARPIRKSVEPRKALKFTISQSHKDKGIKKDPFQCVIAQAMKDLKKGDRILMEVCVYPTVTVLSWSGFVDEIYRTPAYLRKALTDYDNNKGFTLEPGDYELPPVVPSQTKAANAKRARERRERGDVNMNLKYPKKKRLAMPVNPRHTNLKLLQES